MNKNLSILLLFISFFVVEAKSQQCPNCGYKYTEKVSITSEFCNNDTIYKKRELIRDDYCFIKGYVNGFNQKYNKEDSLNILWYESYNMDYVTDKDVIDECDKIREIIVEYFGKEETVEIVKKSGFAVSLSIEETGNIILLEFWYKCFIQDFLTNSDLLNLTQIIVSKIKFPPPSMYKLKKTKLFTVPLSEKYILASYNT